MTGMFCACVKMEAHDAKVEKGARNHVRKEDAKGDQIVEEHDEYDKKKKKKYFQREEMKTTCYLLSWLDWTATYGVPVRSQTKESEAFSDGCSQRYDGNTARLARRGDEALGVRVSVARIAPSLLDLERAATYAHFIVNNLYDEISTNAAQGTAVLPDKTKQTETVDLRWEIAIYTPRGETRRRERLCNITSHSSKHNCSCKAACQSLPASPHVSATQDSLDKFVGGSDQTKLQKSECKVDQEVSALEKELQKFLQHQGRRHTGAEHYMLLRDSPTLANNTTTCSTDNTTLQHASWETGGELHSLADNSYKSEAISVSRTSVPGPCVSLPEDGNRLQFPERRIVLVVGKLLLVLVRVSSSFVLLLNSHPNCTAGFGHAVGRGSSVRKYTAVWRLAKRATSTPSPGREEMFRCSVRHFPVECRRTSCNKMLLHGVCTNALVKLRLHEAEEYAGSRTSAGLQKKLEVIVNELDSEDYHLVVPEAGGYLHRDVIAISVVEKTVKRISSRDIFELSCLRGLHFRVIPVEKAISSVWVLPCPPVLQGLASSILGTAAFPFSEVGTHTALGGRSETDATPYFFHNDAGIHSSYTKPAVHHLVRNILERKNLDEMCVTRFQPLACSPHTKENRFQTHAGQPSDFRMWESCRAAGYLGDLPFPSPLHSGAAPCSLRFTPIGSQDLDVKSRPNIFTHTLLAGTIDRASRLCHAVLRLEFNNAGIGVQCKRCPGKRVGPHKHVYKKQATRNARLSAARNLRLASNTVLRVARGAGDIATIGDDLAMEVSARGHSPGPSSQPNNHACGTRRRFTRSAIDGTLLEALLDALRPSAQNHAHNARKASSQGLAQQISDWNVRKLSAQIPDIVSIVFQFAAYNARRTHCCHHMCSRPPVAQSVCAPPIWAAGGSGFESLARHGDVHTRRTKQKPVTRVEPGETECTAATHERAARHPLHACCDVNWNTTSKLSGNKQRLQCFPVADAPDARLGLEIETKFISNHRNWRFEIDPRSAAIGNK
ncbi:hypothetical protein PR048_029965 [Dryococelus australis]|uniref:Uncharacterized protein n=1 Tax=Dryococelus australis TaxID=614101 RepID=A0ABQ9G7M5_9NEOP|nr:hypothetical protein PR048_029965 [Dryococelus australis]